MSGPCGWSVTTCTCSGKCFDKFSPITRDRVEALATHFMWAATGRRYGLCETTVQLCNPPAQDDLYQSYGEYGPGTGPYPAGGHWHNQTCGGACRCTSRCEVSLPAPVYSIVAVTVDGDVVSPAAYEVHDRRLLVRTDGACWPTCSTYATTPPGFQVTYLRGQPIPTAVQHATEGLACQLAKACEGGDCVLPPRVQSITRQGVSIDVATEEATSVGGRLRAGVAWIDQIIEADNPHGLAARPQVLSLDLPEPRTVSSTNASVTPPTVTAST